MKKYNKTDKNNFHYFLINYKMQLSWNFHRLAV